MVAIFKEGTPVHICQSRSVVKITWWRNVGASCSWTLFSEPWWADSHIIKMEKCILCARTKFWKLNLLLLSINQFVQNLIRSVRHYASVYLFAWHYFMVFVKQYFVFFFLRGSISIFLRGSISWFWHRSITWFLRGSISWFLRARILWYLRGSILWYLCGSISWYLCGSIS